MIGTKPQWIPKMTNTCQNAPRIAPPRIGERFQTQSTASEIVEPALSAIGPITMKVSGTMIATVSIGTTKLRNVSGMPRLSSFSSLDWA